MNVYVCTYECLHMRYIFYWHVFWCVLLLLVVLWLLTC
jgi:type VI protein secretion system component VasF